MPAPAGMKIHEDFDVSDMQERLKYFDLDDVKKMVKQAIQYLHFYVPFWDEYGVYYTYNDTSGDGVAAFLEDSLDEYEFPVIVIRLNILDDLFQQKKERFYKGMFSGMKLKKMAKFSIQTSVYHELCHAIVALDDIYEFIENENMLHFSNEEKYCEDFAIMFFKGQNMPKDVKEFYKVYNKYRKKGKLDVYRGGMVELREVFLRDGKKISKYPTKSWINHALRYSTYGSRRINILAAYVVGSEAKGTAKPDSDLDIALIINPIRGKDALKYTEEYHMKFPHDRYKPHYPDYTGRRVDFQFFYPNDPILQEYSKIKLFGDDGV